MASAPKAALINRRLYRALLRAVKPFTPPSENAAVLSSLLHRSFIPLSVDEGIALRHRDKEKSPESYPMDDNMYPEVEIMEDGDDEDSSSPQRYDPHFLLFRRLLWTLFSDGYSYRPTLVSTKLVPCYQLPYQVKQQPYKLREMIRQEFRVPDTGVDDHVVGTKKKQQPNNYLSSVFSVKVRRDAAFLALRRLNEKLAWADELEASLQKTPPNPKQAARCVEPIRIENNQTDYTSLLTPGTYLVANPHMGGYFRQTVICILNHGEEPNDTRQGGGTYGVIVNRPSISESTGRNRTLADTLNFGLPKEIAKPLGAAPIKDGGPVHMPSIQMLYSVGNRDRKTDDEVLDEEALLEDIGGTKLPPMHGPVEEKMVCYQGDIMKAAKAVTSGQIDQDDVSIFVGASCWYPGQLEREISEGCWLLCRGPAEIALSGTCDHEHSEEDKPRPKADLWLSMMSVFGEEEARLAYLMQAADEEDDYGGPCDEM